MTALERLLAAYAPAASSVQGYNQPSYGTQAAPLDAFYSASGATGNKTTNKDLPEWLRKLGMKGDAYAGGMLKPQIRYGFWYKNGKINFADGTSFAAKKNKDGSYSYTDSSGAAQTYSPTDEQNAYNKRYKASTSNQSFVDKVGNTLGFELFKGKQMLKDFGVNNLFFGVDPAGVKIGNTLTGRNDKPLVDYLGGASAEDFAAYGKPTGYAEPIHDVAHTIAGIYGAQGLGQLAGAGVKSLGAANAAGSSSGSLASNIGTGFGSGVTGSVSGGLASSGAGAIGNVAGAGALGAGMAGTSGATGSWMDWLGPLISAGSSLIAGDKSNDAIRDSSAVATGEARRQFDTVRADTAPVRALGNAAIDRIARYYGYGTADGKPDMTAFFESPDYQFNLEETQQAIDRSKAAQGGLLSGAAVKEGQRYASGLASRENAGFVDRLMQQAGLGNTGIGASASAGMSTANNIGSIATNAGANRASIYQNTGANVNNAIQTGIGNSLLRRYLGA